MKRRPLWGLDWTPTDLRFVRLRPPASHRLPIPAGGLPSMEAALRAFIETHELRGHSVVLTLPAQEFFVHWTRSERMAPAEIAERVFPLPVANLTWGSRPLAIDGEPWTLLAGLPTARLAAYCRPLEAAGLTIAGVAVEFERRLRGHHPVNDDEVWALAVRSGGGTRLTVALGRTPIFSAAADPNLDEAVHEAAAFVRRRRLDRPLARVVEADDHNADDAARGAARAAGDRSALWIGDFHARPSAARQAFQRHGSMGGAVAALVLMITAMGLDTAIGKRRAELAALQATAQVISGPVEKTWAARDIFAAIAGALPKGCGLNDLRLDGEKGRVHLAGSAPDYASVSTLVRTLASDARFKQVASGKISLDPGHRRRVTFSVEAAL